MGSIVFNTQRSSANCVDYTYSLGFAKRMELPKCLAGT